MLLKVRQMVVSDRLWVLDTEIPFVLYRITLPSPVNQQRNKGQARRAPALGTNSEGVPRCWPPQGVCGMATDDAKTAAATAGPGSLYHGSSTALEQIRLLPPSPPLCTALSTLMHAQYPRSSGAWLHCPLLSAPAGLCSGHKSCTYVSLLYFSHFPQKSIGHLTLGSIRRRDQIKIILHF